MVNPIKIIAVAAGIFIPTIGVGSNLEMPFELQIQSLSSASLEDLGENHNESNNVALPLSETLNKPVLKAESTRITTIKSTATARTTQPQKLANYVPVQPTIAKPVVHKPRALTGQPRLQNTAIGNISGTAEIRFDRPQRIRQWGEVYYDLLDQTNRLKHCINHTKTCNDPVLVGWANQIRPLGKLGHAQRIQAINNLVNQKAFRRDIANFASVDHWAAPVEFLTSSGDCEDYAILKFASLMALNIDNHDLRLVVGNITGIGSHAFLSVKLNGEEFLLDNRTNVISAAATRLDFQPKHSMNFTHRWVHTRKKVKGRTT